LSIWNLPARLWSGARSIEDLLTLHKETRTALDVVNARLSALEQRMTLLEAGQGQVISKSRAAAGMAATGMASSIIADVVTRITRLEMRQDDGQSACRRRKRLQG
jgi:voltage-gated potassium channel Kch